MADERYTLSAEKIDSTSLRLIGHELKLGAGDELPALQGQHVATGQAELAPASISFFATAQTTVTVGNFCYLGGVGNTSRVVP